MEAVRAFVVRDEIGTRDGLEDVVDVDERGEPIRDDGADEWCPCVEIE